MRGSIASDLRAVPEEAPVGGRPSRPGDTDSAPDSETRPFHSAGPAAEARPATMVAAATLVVFASAIVALHLVGARDRIGALWGAHFFAFLPLWACLFSLGLPCIAAAPLIRWIAIAARRGRAAGGPLGMAHETFQGALVAASPSSVPALEGAPPKSIATRILVWSAVAAAGAAVLWVVRARHNLLGDGVPIVAQGSTAGALHELEPLTALLQAGAFDLLRFFSGPGHTARVITWNAVAMVSVGAGALFIPVSWAIAREIASAPAPDRNSGGGRPSSEASAASWGIVALVAAILLTQGYLQLFCGYVENYAPLALANGLVFLSGLRFARGRGSLLAAGAATAFAIALHLSAAAWIPAWIVLSAWGVLRGPDRRRARMDLGLTVLVAIAVTVLLARLRPGYLLPRTLWDVTIRAVGQRQEDPTYLLSLRHLFDFLNEQVLIGPLGIFAFAAGLTVAIGRGAWRRPDVALAAVAGRGVAGACLVAGDSNMGYARNWDLLAPAGVVLTAAGLLLSRPAFRPVRLWRGALLLALALSAFHTLPWVALNASERRSVERFATLPLGKGRTENTVAFWYAERGDFPEAKRWLKRSLAANPQNSRAMDLYGRIAFEERDARMALRAYLVAVTIRPDKPEYREQLARAVAAFGGPVAGLGQVDSLMTGHLDNGGLWLERSMLLRASGRIAESAEARRRAVALWPNLAAMADSLPPL